MALPNRKYNPRARNPTREQRLKDFIGQLESSIEENKVLACSRVPSDIELRVRWAGEDVRSAAARLRRSCHEKGLFGKLCLLFNIRLIIFGGIAIFAIAFLLNWQSGCISIFEKTLFCPGITSVETTE